MSGLPVSVLDLTPVSEGSTAGEAARNTIDLGRAADRLGYARHWLAEHHNTPGMACPSPEVMIGQVAAATSRIRVGSGGVMLPNHSPLRIAEVFRLLEALHPGRIDLGIGRAPGTDAVTAYALRRSTTSGEEFPSQLAELFAFAGEGFPDDHPFRSIAAQPADVDLPPVWILGSSDFGARVAAAAGLGFAFARHLNPRGAEAALALYRDGFRPGALPQPRTILCTSGIVAGTREEAEWLSGSLALGIVRMRSGRPSRLPTPEEAAAHRWTPAEEDQVRRYMRAQVLGDPAGAAARLSELAEETGADELMLMTTVHDHALRVRSYELLAGAMGLTAETPSPVDAIPAPS